MYKSAIFAICLIFFDWSFGEICEQPEPEFCSMVQMNALSPAANQLVDFRASRKGPVGPLTTATGRPLTKMEASESLNQDLLLIPGLIKEFTDLVRTSLPRIVHAKGGGAFGTFIVTHNRQDITNMALFSKIGKKTPVVCRFSSEVFEVGSADTVRDNRGMACKFYTEEGNWDFLGLLFPVFGIKNPIKFPDLLHSNGRNPQTFNFDANSKWDFFIKNPESVNFMIQSMGDSGIPCSFENVPGYPIHTFITCNNKGERFFVRFRMEPKAGERGLSSKDAERIRGEDPDYHLKLLYDQIAEGRYPCWTLYIQALSEKEAMSTPFDILDTTRDFNVTLIKPQPIGELCLTKNPTNFQRDIEQLAFCVLNQPPGIQGAPSDAMFKLRALAYDDAQNYRLGGNQEKIPVNTPLYEVFTYLRDGPPPLGDNGNNAPNYYPNSFFGPEPTAKPRCKKFTENMYINPGPTNFGDAAAFFNDLSEEEQENVVNNIVASLSLVTATDVRTKAVELWTQVDAGLGERITTQLELCPAPPENTPS